MAMEMTSSTIRVVCITVGMMLAAAGCKQAETRADAPGAAELVQLQTRSGVTQSILLVRAPNPTAAVVLLPGGAGRLQLGTALGRPTVNGQKGNFLVRTKDDFASRGLLVALLDAPSDRQRGAGMKGGFRNSPEHMRDLGAVIMHLQQEFSLPVWLVGTSRGTESAAQAAVDLGDRIAGVVLTSSISEPNPQGLALTQMPLDQVRVPVLVVAHEDDACRITPAAGAQAIASDLTNAPMVEVKTVRGGHRAQGKPCQGKTAHGFFGVERDVLDLITAFIDAQSNADAR